MKKHIAIGSIKAGEITLIVRCTGCGEGTAFTLSTKDVSSWQEGANIQDVWPEMSREHREMLVSGTCTPCWEELMGIDP